VGCYPDPRSTPPQPGEGPAPTWHPLVVGGVDIAITASFGLASYLGEKELDVEALMGRAEAAVALAKAQGRDRVSHWKPD